MKIRLAILGVLATVGVVSAQDYIYNNFMFANKDYPLPPACVYNQGVKLANPYVFDGDTWVLYVCNDDTQFSRRFFSHHPIDTGVPVYPNTNPTNTYSCPAGFFPGVNGGCVDWNHPDRKK